MQFSTANRLSTPVRSKLKPRVKQAFAATLGEYLSHGGLAGMVPGLGSVLSHTGGAALGAGASEVLSRSSPFVNYAARNPYKAQAIRAASGLALGGLEGGLGAVVSPSLTRSMSASGAAKGILGAAGIGGAAELGLMTPGVRDGVLRAMLPGATGLDASMAGMLGGEVAAAGTRALRSRVPAKQLLKLDENTGRILKQFVSEGNAPSLRTVNELRSKLLAAGAKPRAIPAGVFDPRSGALLDPDGLARYLSSLQSVGSQLVAKNSMIETAAGLLGGGIVGGLEGGLGGSILRPLLAGGPSASTGERFRNLLGASALGIGGEKLLQQAGVLLDGAPPAGNSLAKALGYGGLAYAGGSQVLPRIYRPSKAAYNSYLKPRLSGDPSIHSYALPTALGASAAIGGAPILGTGAILAAPFINRNTSKYIREGLDYLKERQKVRELTSKASSYGSNPLAAPVYPRGFEKEAFLNPALGFLKSTTQRLGYGAAEQVGRLSEMAQNFMRGGKSLRRTGAEQQYSGFANLAAPLSPTRPLTTGYGASFRRGQARSFADRAGVKGKDRVDFMDYAAEGNRIQVGTAPGAAVQPQAARATNPTAQGTLNASTTLGAGTEATQGARTRGRLFFNTSDESLQAAETARLRNVGDGGAQVMRDLSAADMRAMSSSSGFDSANKLLSISQRELGAIGGVQAAELSAFNSALQNAARSGARDASGLKQQLENAGFDPTRATVIANRVAGAPRFTELTGAFDSAYNQFNAQLMGRVGRGNAATVQQFRAVAGAEGALVQNAAARTGMEAQRLSTVAELASETAAALGQTSPAARSLVTLVNETLSKGGPNEIKALEAELSKLLSGGASSIKDLSGRTLNIQTTPELARTLSERFSVSGPSAGLESTIFTAKSLLGGGTTQETQILRQALGSDFAALQNAAARSSEAGATVNRLLAGQIDDAARLGLNDLAHLNGTTTADLANKLNGVALGNTTQSALLNQFKVGRLNIGEQIELAEQAKVRARGITDSISSELRRLRAAQALFEPGTIEHVKVSREIAARTTEFAKAESQFKQSISSLNDLHAVNNAVKDKLKDELTAVDALVGNVKKAKNVTRTSIIPGLQRVKAISPSAFEGAVGLTEQQLKTYSGLSNTVSREKVVKRLAKETGMSEAQAELALVNANVYKADAAAPGVAQVAQGGSRLVAPVAAGAAGVAGGGGAGYYASQRSQARQNSGRGRTSRASFGSSPLTAPISNRVKTGSLLNAPIF